MEGMKFNEQEGRVFGDLFSLCEVDNSGKVFGPQASELFIKSGLSTDILHQILELCGAKRLGHFGRSQFYVALKLISFAQMGVPLTSDNISTGIEIPLPKFDMKKISHIQSTGFPYPGSQLPPPPPKQVRQVQQGRNSQGFEQTNNVSNMNSSQIEQTTATSPVNPSPPLSPNSNQACLPGGATASAKPHPQVVTVSGNPTGAAVAHVHPQQGGVGAAGYNHYDAQQQLPHKLEKGWASFENDDDNQGLITDQRKEWAQFTDSSKADTSSMSSETDSMTDDVWYITEEQREYYVNQFKTMQPDVTGLISGAVAKEFFEKSRLPIAELSKIWQLSDVNKDGALNLEEFCTAMHLVVLRRNEIELPNHLPPSLVPYVSFANPDEPFATDLPKGSTIKKTNSPSTAKHQWVNNTFPIPESPASSSISSPGQKPTPLSFDFKPIGVVEDSDIVHPVPLRMSPDGLSYSVDQQGTTVQTTDPGGYNSQDLSPNDQLSPTTKQDTEQLVDIGEEAQSHSIHHPVPTQAKIRPTPKKAQPGPSLTQQQQQQPFIFAPTSSQDSAEHSGRQVSEEVPVPPPRKSHSRSASLDTTQLLDAAEKGKDSSIAPPMVPPRPKEGSSVNPDTITTTSLSSQTKKITQESGGGTEETDPTKPKVLSKPDSQSQEKKELLAQIKKQKEKNETLCRLNSELNQELQEVMEQRIALEIQMEHLRPYGGSYL